jgi:hypothetical protein
MKASILALLVIPLAGCAVRDTNSAPIEQPMVFAAAVQSFLDDKGGYCLGKPDWPRLVTEEERRKHKADALQMPVLERLGVVSGTPLPGDETKTLYSLTDAGSKFYVRYAVPGASLAGAPTQIPGRPGDLCVAQLKVVRVTKWTPVQVADGVATTMVSYTYEIAAAAPWTDDPEFRKVFPLVAQILSSGNQLEMMLPLQWTGHRWISTVPPR